MLQKYISKTKLLFGILLFTIISVGANAQTISRTSPRWWFGISGAANMNYYRGNTQMLNSTWTTPTAFHKGTSVRPYASMLTEYRANKYWGFMLNTTFDNRGGKFDPKIAACDCPINLTTNLSYVAIEPSIRLAPFGSSFYLFAGPTIGININKEFKYAQEGQQELRADWSSINKTPIAAQIGAGFDIPLSGRVSETQMTLSPFASFQTDFFQSPRSVETWSIYSVRAGLALKMGSIKRKTIPARTKIIMIPAAAKEKDIQFSVRAPKVLPLQRQIKETFPIRNSVFFNMGSTTIPNRYILLSKADAKAFKETQLQENQPTNLNKGRSARQLEVYYNILNILGDRMRKNAKTTINLVGASDQNPPEGKMMAEQIKLYLVNQFDIESNRIKTEGRDKPVIPSEQPGAIDELDLLHEGDRRVDIESNSTELLMQIGGNNVARFKPVEIVSFQQDPLDSHVIFKVEGANEVLKEWSIDIMDESNFVQHFGPFTVDQASVPGNNILGNKTQGNYTIILTGQTKLGSTIVKTSSVSLIKVNASKQVGLRYSILFDFDKSKSINSYEDFLTNIVAPLIEDNSTVIIHGYTDIIGGVKYNLNLSRERAFGVEDILKRATIIDYKKGVQFETYGFGEDLRMSPFENGNPEERFYNRTVIIDIIPNK